ncbi:hypothetical protein [Neptunicella sp. SCSIO 80796]|uniref:hypothetical protein n=1 Tax=Neptunicella plasticusilytica TaxID=3117012 RepID=UPI003A4D8ABE
MGLQDLTFWFGHWLDVYNNSVANHEDMALGAIKALYLACEHSHDQDVADYCKNEIWRWWDECSPIHGQPAIHDVWVFPSVSGDHHAATF